MKRLIFVYLVMINFNFANVLEYINSIRTHSGASHLKYSKTLSFAAKKHAIYLQTNHEFGHRESKTKINFFGLMPWNRISKAGFGSKAVVENISFGEKDYRKSVDKIMATVYHRLAFLDIKVDSIGFAKYYNIYVYDMGNSNISLLCKQEFSIATPIIDGLCSNYKQIPLTIFKSVLNKIKKRSKSIIIYPYAKQKNVSLSLATERPKFTNKKGYGLPITVAFNSYYYKNVRVKNFKLKRGNKIVPSKIVTFGNDRSKKLKKGTFVLLPLHKLKQHTKYTVVFNAVADGIHKKLIWNFTTR